MIEGHGIAGAPPASVLSLPELHGALTHLPIVALAVLALLSVLAWRGIGGEHVRRAEPWAFVASFAGIALAGLSGLLVNGRAKTTLRGADATLGSVHLFLGIITGLVMLGLGARRLAVWRRGDGDRFATPAGAGVILFVAVAAMGWLGGQMTYQQAVGVSSGGELARSAPGCRAARGGPGVRHATRARRSAGVSERPGLRGLPRHASAGPTRSPAVRRSRPATVSPQARIGSVPAGHRQRPAVRRHQRLVGHQSGRWGTVRGRMTCSRSGGVTCPPPGCSRGNATMGGHGWSTNG